MAAEDPMANSRSNRDRFNLESRLALATVAGCAIVGMYGLLRNRLSLGSTHLDSLLMVGVLYQIIATAAAILAR